MVPIFLEKLAITPTYSVQGGPVLTAISHSRSEPLITCDIGKIYDNHFVTKKFAPCHNFDEFDKKHPHGLISMYLYPDTIRLSLDTIKNVMISRSV